MRKSHACIHSGARKQRPEVTTSDDNDGVKFVWGVAGRPPFDYVARCVAQAHDLTACVLGSTGCDCSGACCSAVSGCGCSALALECGPLCFCTSATCSNRVSQQGPCGGLVVRDTGDAARRFGVFCSRPLPSGAFVAEYCGEVISAAERARRGPASEYVFVAREHFASRTLVTTIDARLRGNVARFFNHACGAGANMTATIVRRRGEVVPHVCFFARRDIAAGAELTFDYCAGDPAATPTSTPCRCGSTECRGWLPQILL